MAFQLTDANFQESVLDREGITLIDFWAEWCGPCRMIAPIIDELHADYEGQVLVSKLDVDSNPEVSMRYGIRSIPTIVIVKNGEVVEKHVGATSKQSLKEKIDKHLVLN